MLPEIEYDEDLFDANGGQKNKGWLICNHFKGLHDILSHYRNFHPIIVFSGTILCDNCYRNMIKGKQPQVSVSGSEVADSGLKKIIGEALIEANEKIQGDIIFGV